MVGKDLYGPRRQYKRKDAGPDDEKTRVQITLLEYGNNGLFAPKLSTQSGGQNATNPPMICKKLETNDLFSGDENNAFNDNNAMAANEVFHAFVFNHQQSVSTSIGILTNCICSMYVLKYNFECRTQCV